MSLLTRISGVFRPSGSRAAGRSARPGSIADADSTFTTRRVRPNSPDTPADAADDARDHAEPEVLDGPPGAPPASPPGFPSGQSDPTADPASVRAIAPAPKNKQELLEELHKNYQEVLELVRKVDTHLDSERERGKEVTDIARRLDQALPALVQTPERLAQVGEQIAGAIERASAGDRAHLEDLRAGVGELHSTIRESAGSQAELVTTMAAFRETLTDVGRHSARSNELLQAVERAQEAQASRMDKTLASSRLWTIGALAVALSISTVGVAIAIVALTQ